MESVPIVPIVAAANIVGTVPEDNVEPMSGDSSPEVIAKASAENNTAPNAMKLFSLAEAINMIASHHRRSLESVKLKLPHHIMDGAVIEFIDQELDMTIGAAKIFMMNSLLVDNASGKISVEIMLGEVSISRRQIVVNIGTPAK